MGSVRFDVRSAPSYASSDLRRLSCVIALALFAHLVALWLIPGRQNATWFLPQWRPDHELRVELARRAVVSPEPMPAAPLIRSDVKALPHLPAYPRRAGAVPRDLGTLAPGPLVTRPAADAHLEPSRDAGAGADDLESLKAQAGKIAANRMVTQDMPYDRLIHAPNANEKFHEEVEKAKRPDCRTAYAGGGILAIPLLLENTITGTGCKW